MTDDTVGTRGVYLAAAVCLLLGGGLGFVIGAAWWSCVCP
jgi:hypothetical protein